MTSTELKHQAKLREWAAAIEDCRSNGLSVRQWCRQRGITTTTYYRWEREVLSIVDAQPKLPVSPAVSFAELPAPKQQQRNVPKCSTTVRIGEFGIDFYQEISPELLKTIVAALRTC